ncbi:hypothetical protein ElyMa_005433100 [Elysia marginata]|uniref:ISXO2-like transposase domain-containing protein n=1 Tax=Elysia marginata TaxID=1093978 RepID=A0AAV4ELZ8_9GAST|nr:hypothetical protein ElyMa_005433100 [Elysia marginata]
MVLIRDKINGKVCTPTLDVNIVRYRERSCLVTLVKQAERLGQTQVGHFVAIDGHHMVTWPDTALSGRRNNFMGWNEYKKLIRPGSIIYSDSWPAYRQLSELGYGHDTVNHKKHFVKPGEPEVNTQKVERLWRDIKEWVKRPGIRSRYFQQYLARYLFVTAVPEPQQLHRFFIEASKLYPPFSEVVRRQPGPEVVSEDEGAVA